MSIKGCHLHLNCECPTPGACPIVAALHGAIEREPKVKPERRPTHMEYQAAAYVAEAECARNPAAILAGKRLGAREQLW